MNPQVRSPTCGKVCCLVMSTTVITVTLIFMIFASVSVVNPYVHEKKFMEVQCNTTSVAWTTENLKCNCHSEYDDKEICTEGEFHCLNILAWYTDTDGMKHVGMVYNSYSDMIDDLKCSYPACNAYDRSYEIDIPGMMINIVRNKAVNDFADTYSEGSVYTCYYNPSNGKELVIHKEFNAWTTFHVIFWPLLIILITLVLTVVLLRALRPKCHTSGVEFNRFY